MKTPSSDQLGGVSNNRGEPGPGDNAKGLISKAEMI